jgi:SAM-dependent methyltransferase
VHRSAIWPGLVSEWELDPEWARWMDQREGTRCAWCGANLRSDQMAQAILAVLREQCSVSAKCLAEAFALPQVQRLAIAEINSAGNLHPHLARCPGLRYSEYGGNRPSVPSENLLALSYSDAQFDLVLTSDTLEHVPDVDQALRETLRVLKPGGAHVISVPIVWPRATRQRATLRDGVSTSCPRAITACQRRANTTSWCSTSLARTSSIGALLRGLSSKCCARTPILHW